MPERGKKRPAIKTKLHLDLLLPRFIIPYSIGRKPLGEIMPKPLPVIKYFSVIALMLAALAACSQKVATPDAKAPAGAATKGGYPIERIKESNACFDIKIEYPFFGRPELDQQVRLWVDNKYYDVSEELQAICAAEPAGSAYRPYKYSVSYDIFSTPGTLSVVFKSWSYTGGAHGQDGIQTLALAVANGDELRYRDIFAATDELYTFLSDYVYSALKPRLGDIWQGAPMFTEGLEPVESSFKNFAITPKGLTVYFPTYQIAPYSEGPQVCEVPLEELIKFRPKPGIWQ